MNALLKSTLALLVLSSIGCGNAHMKEINPNGGTITLYAMDGHVIDKFQTDGKPEMHQGGHIFCRQRDTHKLVIVYGIYTFVEDDDKPK